MTKRVPTKPTGQTARRAAQVYPFAAIVGQEEMKLALLLNVIDPLIGGVLIMGHRGTGKSTAVRALADLLPQIWKTADCAYGCDPDETENLCDACDATLTAHGKLARTRAVVPVVDLPLGATEDRVCGTINLERALQEGVKAFEPGLLARAHRGFLYVDEVNLLEDHLVDLLLDVAVTGRNTVERESISLTHPSRFVLVGSGNPEEGELRPQLLDRFGLYVEVQTVTDLEQRVRIVSLREAFERDPAKFRAEFEAEQQSLRRRLTRARKLATQVTISTELLRAIAALCLQLRIDGHRGELTIARAARALSAFEGRREASEADVQRVAPLALRHRLRRDPLEPTGGGQRITQALEKNFSQAEARSTRAQSESKPQHWPDKDQPERPTPAPSDAQLPADALQQNSQTPAQARTPEQSAHRSRGRGRTTHDARRGRYTRAVINRPPEAKVALDATLRAIAQSPRSQVPGPRLADLRYKKFKRKQGTLFILAIDTSGSMALNRIEQAKGALVWLLNKSYLRRDRVALVSFRGAQAEELLSPSQSMSRARRLLDEMLMGGATPLASALACAHRIAKRAALQGTERVVLLLFTDGRANVALREQHLNSPATKQDVQAALVQELEQLGAALSEARVSTVLVDTQNRFTSGGVGRALALRLGARYLYLSSGGAIDERLQAANLLEA
ncbi:MAG: magnesium chelatase ATPase subunit I [Acidobacteria bacterium]|nr:magnesium chelatase ATPase subunit I [Acidobacteriota bacterium]